MSAEKMITEREALLRRREAFESGAHWFYAQAAVPIDLGTLLDNIAEVAAKMYPLPKVTRPRVVRVRNYEFKVEGDVMMERDVVSGGRWDFAQGWAPSADYAATWADLFANPTEEVEG